MGLEPLKLVHELDFMHGGSFKTYGVAINEDKMMGNSSKSSLYKPHVNYTPPVWAKPNKKVK